MSSAGSIKTWMADIRKAVIGQENVPDDGLLKRMSLVEQRLSALEEMFKTSNVKVVMTNAPTKVQDKSTKGSYMEAAAANANPRSILVDCITNGDFTLLNDITGVTYNTYFKRCLAEAKECTSNGKKSDALTNIYKTLLKKYEDNNENKNANGVRRAIAVVLYSKTCVKVRCDPEEVEKNRKLIIDYHKNDKGPSNAAPMPSDKKSVKQTAKQTVKQSAKKAGKQAVKKPTKKQGKQSDNDDDNSSIEDIDLSLSDDDPGTE